VSAIVIKLEKDRKN